MLRAVRDLAPPSRGARVARGLLASGWLLLALLVLTMLAAGPLRPVDIALNFQHDRMSFNPTLLTIDRIGQRAVCVPVLVVVAALAGRRRRSWRPLVVAGLSVLVVNVAVGVLKLGLERGAPYDRQPAFFVDGVMYPSGHSANVVLVYGLAAYLWWRYAGASRRTRVWLVAAVVFLAHVMVLVSLALGFHWFTDLVAGVLVGGAVLQAVTTVDRAMPLRR
ncbi:MAG: phosphatase PAP2 family protein [Propionibacteriales bacterium]|nr:phosphatase PAP2 family protein [Propionibacteriales bacterium]